MLEPPPIAYAGVSALYSREFYELARTRLTPDGYISQWLPSYQVPSAIALAMVRAFVDVFPQSVLLSGAASDLLLLGVNGPRIEIDPGAVSAALSSAPAVRADLERIDLGTVHEIVGTFVASARTLNDATRGARPSSTIARRRNTACRSMLSIGHGVPAVDYRPRPGGGMVSPLFHGRHTRAGRRGPRRVSASCSPWHTMLHRAEVADAGRLAETEGRTVAGSAYLGAIVPESAELHNVLGVGARRAGTARRGYRGVSSRVASGARQRSRALAPRRRACLAGDASPRPRRIWRDRWSWTPRNSQAHSDLGLVLALQGRLDEAAGHLQRAIALDPQAEDARRNLALVEARRKGGR